MAEGWVDLRSDTVSRPTPTMRRAMAEAEVGDDGYGEDPTVNRLEEVFAARVGKDRALLVPSGTMGNQVALRVLAPPGTIVAAGRRTHPVAYEHGAAALNAGVQLYGLDDGDRGRYRPEEIRWLVAAADHHHPTTSLVCVEHPHMPSGGWPWDLPTLDAVAAVGPAIHLDGARLFNAEVATGVPAAGWASRAVTVMCCLSKGLGAPVGSLLAGPAEVIDAAREARARLGGGMRQAGVLAGAGLVALEEMVDRLAEDHHRAQRLAEAVAERWPGRGTGPDRCPTNMVVFTHDDPAALVAHLRGEGVLAGTIAPGTIRFATHWEVDDAAVERACKALAGAP